MFKLLCALSLLIYSDAYRILVVFPIPGKSHAILGSGYVRHLLEAGHEVTYITPVPIKNSSPRLQQIDVSENFKFLSADVFNVQTLLNKQINLQNYMVVMHLFTNFMNNTLRLEPLKKFMNDPNQQFDLVIAEWLYNEMGSGFAAVFNCPLIWSSSMVPHTFVLSLINEHLNPAYAVDHLETEYSLSLWTRVRSLWKLYWVQYNRWANSDFEEKVFQETYGKAIRARGREPPSFNEVRFNGSLMLGNSHISTGDSIPLPQNYKDIGGYHIQNVVEPLPQDLQKIMDEANNGVIYFSLGTMLKSNDMPQSLREGLVKTFSELNQTVIWKFETDMTNLPKNVHIVSWAPQASILAHPNCVLFITHGGLLSTLEALNYGVPLIGMPFFADQFLNIERAAVKGFGKRMDLGQSTPEELKPIIIEMTKRDSTYQKRAKEMSVIFHDRMVPPGKELVYWVEHVIRTRGAPHLKPLASQMEWYKKQYLDLFAIVIIGGILAYILLLKSPMSSKKKVD